jgi:hypothetical protein
VYYPPASAPGSAITRSTIVHYTDGNFRWARDGLIYYVSVIKTVFFWRDTDRYGWNKILA